MVVTKTETLISRNTLSTMCSTMEKNRDEFSITPKLEWLQEHGLAIALIMILIMIIFFIYGVVTYGEYVKYINTEPCDACERMKNKFCIDKGEMHEDNKFNFSLDLPQT